MLGIEGVRACCVALLENLLFVKRWLDWYAYNYDLSTCAMIEIIYFVVCIFLSFRLFVVLFKWLVIVDCTISAQGGGVCVDKISFFYQLV